jgi:hypothetical protein
MEKSVLTVLKFEMNKPLPINFLRRFAKAGSIDQRQYIEAKYFIELAAIDYELTQYSPSQIAAAAIYLTLYISESNSDRDLWTPTLVFYSTYNVEDFLHIAQRLALLASSAHESKLKNVFDKYAQAENWFVAAMPRMIGVAICMLADQALLF